MMVTQVIEVNFDQKLIDSFIPGSLFSRAKSILVFLEPQEGKEGLYKVHIEAAYFAYQNNQDQGAVSASEESSKIINRFINLLISVCATESTEKNSKKETVPA
jgi:hypothetical protein